MNTHYKNNIKGLIWQLKLMAKYNYCANKNTRFIISMYSARNDGQMTEYDELC